MIAGKFKRYIKGAGLTAAAAVGLFLFAGTSNAQYGGYGYPQPNYGGYGNYGGYNNGRYDNNERKRVQKAYEKGIKDGRKQGERDAKNGNRSNRNYGGYNNNRGILGAIFGGGYGNGSYNGRSGQEQQAYSDGYRQGYQEGYDRYRGSRNRGWSNGRSWPF